MTVGFCMIYLVATEYISSQKSKGEVLLFRRGQVPNSRKENNDEEGVVDDRPSAHDMVALQKTKSEVPPNIQKQTAIFHWAAVKYDIKVKGGERRLLDDVDGWVKPGTLTAVSDTFLHIECSEEPTCCDIARAGSAKIHALDQRHPLPESRAFSQATIVLDTKFPICAG
jgi:hypothetical protein